MDPQILLDFSLALLTTGLILLFKGIFILGIGSLIIAIILKLFGLYLVFLRNSNMSLRIPNQKKKKMKKEKAS